MNIWNKIKQALENNNKLYLLTVIQSSGSAPGRRGFMMLVDDQNNLFGSIGGGIMEFKLVEKAKELLSKNNLKSFNVKQIHRGDAHSSSGMICSGEQTIAFTPISKSDKECINLCAHSGMIQITHEGIKPLEQMEDETCLIQSENQWRYTQSLYTSTTIHLFGAGHVSVPTCELLHKLGCHINLYDNRLGINTYEDNHWVNSKQVIDYSQVHDFIEFNERDYVILMTHKFTEDKLILSQLLATKCDYLGVLGSKNKIKIMFNALLKEGCNQAELDKVSAPIGLDINSRTTEEIAISIVAEVIKIKNS